MATGNGLVILGFLMAWGSACDSVGEGEPVAALVSAGMQLQGMQLQGMQLQGMQLQGTELRGLLGETQVGGRDLIGATLVGRALDGSAVHFQISDVQVDPGDSEILRYALQHWDAAVGAWRASCPADESGGGWAIPVRGVWDERGARADSSDAFTFGCTTGVIAKCVRWGYKPWKSVGGVSLVAHHQTCTRMARADYCGQGRPHTRDGTAIDIYDTLGIQRATPGSGMVFEAAWVPEGAYCINKERWNLIGALIALECLDRLHLPALSDVLHEDSCFVRLSGSSRSQVLLSNRSFLAVSL